MKTPKVSVLMTVYNGQEYLNIAIDSILKQTFKDFELIIMDDGSTDNTRFVVENYNDKRIVYVYQDNQGQAAALNNGIQIARGDYIARMDADDISYKNRLELQVKFLDDNVQN